LKSVVTRYLQEFAMSKTAIISGNLSLDFPLYSLGHPCGVVV